MGNGQLEAKLVVIRQYLSENVSQSTVHDGPTQNGERTLIVIFGRAGYCTLQISYALLTDLHPTPPELNRRLKICNIVGKVLLHGSFYLNHDAISDESIVNI